MNEMRENKGEKEKTTKTGIERNGWRVKCLNMKASCWFLNQRRRKRAQVSLEEEKQNPRETVSLPTKTPCLGG